MKKKRIISVISRREPLPENIIKRRISLGHVLSHEEAFDTTLASNFFNKPTTALDETTSKFIIKQARAEFIAYFREIRVSNQSYPTETKMYERDYTLEKAIC